MEALTGIAVPSRITVAVTGIILAGLAAFLTRGCLLRVRVIGQSMYPTLTDGQVVWLVKRRSKIAPGDVVAFRSPPAARAEVPVLIKRCVAVAGQLSPLQDRVVPAGAIWVDGDGLVSGSSETFGTISLSDVVGRRRNLPPVCRENNLQVL